MPSARRRARDAANADPAVFFDRLREVADRNQARLKAWGESDFVRDADTLDPSLVPEGLVYPLPVPDAFWFDVGPDLT